MAVKMLLLNEMIVFSFLYTEFCLYILSVTANAAEIKTRETREIQIGLKRDGNLIDNNNIPKCGNDGTIYLISYKYHQLQCHFTEDCSSVHEESLLPIEEFHLHQMCSMQHQCKKMSFTLGSEAHRNRTNAIIIRYKCIDQKRLVNICEKIERTSRVSVYVTSADIKESFTECQCFVNSGQFKISFTDIRLNDNLSNTCSPATLHVNDKVFVCDKSRNGSGAVFKKSPEEPLRNAYISLMQNSKTALPDSVLMELQPEISLRITCQGRQTTRITNVNGSTSMGRSISTSNLPPTTTVLANDDVIKNVIMPGTNGPQCDSTVPVILPFVVVTLCIATAIFTMLIILIRRRKNMYYGSKPTVKKKRVDDNCADTESALTLLQMKIPKKVTRELIPTGQRLTKLDEEVRKDPDSAYNSLTDKHSVNVPDVKNRNSKLPQPLSRFGSQSSKY